MVPRHSNTAFDRLHDLRDGRGRLDQKVNMVGHHNESHQQVKSAQALSIPDDLGHAFGGHAFGDSRLRKPEEVSAAHPERNEDRGSRGLKVRQISTILHSGSNRQESNLAQRKPHRLKPVPPFAL
jgi:hypothetical protein